MIHLQDINKTYQGAQPLHVLKGISLDIAKGEFVSIMGASGSGKSTLLNILGILDNYDSGTYELAGVPWDILRRFVTNGYFLSHAFTISSIEISSSCIWRKSSGRRSFMNSCLRAFRICFLAPLVTK